MENITNVKEYTVSGEFDIQASIRPDKDSAESKNVTLRFILNSVSLQDVLTRALHDARISWANGGGGRSKFDTISDRSILRIDFASPGKKVKTREEAIEEAKAVLIKYGVKAEELEVLAKAIVDNPTK